MNAKQETKPARLVIHLKEGSHEVEVPKDITKELASISSKVNSENLNEVRLYIEGAVAALAKYQRAKGTEEGTPLYACRDAERGLIASKNAKAIAQFLYANKWLCDFHPAIGGENQLFTTKLLDQSGVCYSLQLFPDRRSVACDVLLELWDTVEL